jgi:hypothetical protein
MPSAHRKPWYRARNILLALFALAAAWIGREVYLALTAVPGQAIDYGQLSQELAIAALPPEARAQENAYPDVQKVVEIMTAAGNEARAREVPANLAEATPQPAPWDFSVEYSISTYPPAELAWVREGNDIVRAFARQAGLDEALDGLATRLHAIRPPQQGPMFNWLLPDLGTFRNIARMNAAAMAAATRDGDSQALLAAFGRTLTLGRICTQQTWVIERLVGVAIFSLASSQLAVSTTERAWDEATLRAALDLLDARAAEVPPFTLVVEGERLMGLDLIQYTHTDNGRGDGRLITSRLGWIGGFAGAGIGGGAGSGGWLDSLFEWKIANILSAGYASKKANIRQLNRFYDATIALAKVPRWERVSLPDPEQMVLNLPPRYPVLKMMLPAFVRSLQSEDQFRSTIAATRLLLLIEIYRCRHGDYPQSLDALVPELIPALPPDPVNGKRYGYRRLQDDPHGRGYLLYSFGADGVDNAGEMPENKTAAAMSNFPAGQGKDWVFNQPRER